MCFTIWYGLPSTIHCSFSFLSIFRAFPDIPVYLFFQINFITTFLAPGNKKAPTFQKHTFIHKRFFLSVSKTSDTPSNLLNVLVT